jgi:hypothetical protein
MTYQPTCYADSYHACQPTLPNLATKPTTPTTPRTLTLHFKRAMPTLPTI